MKNKKFMVDLLDEVSLNGMSKILGGNADPQVTINNGEDCQAINGSKNCDVINSGGKCLLINQQKLCKVTNITVSCTN